MKIEGGEGEHIEVESISDVPELDQRITHTRIVAIRNTRAFHIRRDDTAIANFGSTAASKPGVVVGEHAHLIRITRHGGVCRHAVSV